jgi:cytochrome c
MNKHSRWHPLWCCAVLYSASVAGCDVNTAADPRLGTGANAGLGAAKIEQYGCGSCHTIPGVPGARAHVGPPLTAFNRRTYIAGKLANDPANLELWIMHPRSVRPDTAMPEMGVTKNDAADIAAYLYLVR